MVSLAVAERAALRADWAAVETPHPRRIMKLKSTFPRKLNGGGE